MRKRNVCFGIKISLLMAGLWSFFGVSFCDVYGESFDSFENVGDISNEAVLPELFIAAVNPGYKIDGISNVGEMIEIGRRDISDESFSLAGITVSYTNSSGVQTTIFEFPENSWMTGESTLLRLASSSGGELATLSYVVKGASAGISQSAGPLILMKDGKEIDSVCWTGIDGCERKFKSASNESLVRNRETGQWSFVVNYEPVFDVDSYHVKNDEDNNDKVEPQCKNLQFSELLSYYETSRSEQFIELYNSGSEQVLLNGCKIKYKNKEYVLNGLVKPEEYFAYYPVEFSLTKNPTNFNRLELIDANGDIVDLLDYPNGQRKGTSYMFVGYSADGKTIWRVTYLPTPGAPNNYQEFKSCEEGKTINEATGNCVKITSVSEKICGEGYYLNILTGRCRKIEVTTDKTCKEGYYLNPETGRCRKIKENNGADYEIKAENYEEKSSFVALNIVLIIIGIGTIYLIYEFRHEIRKLCGKVFRRFR